MNRTLLRQVAKLTLGVLGSLVLGSAKAGPLVSYSFDDDQLDTGPDTFRVFEYSQGTAQLSSEFRYSGYHSVEIRDAANDGGFPELQGYFPMQYSGTLYVHFAFMTPTPHEPFNIALAGPKWFRLKKDGIGFWLKNQDGYFYQVSERAEKRLAKIQPYTWYLVDLAYHVSEGRYDLRMQEEYQTRAIVDLKGVANATGEADSKVYVFSFIGDLPDEASAVIYVDDIDIRTDQPIRTQSLIAPGRRKLFIDYWKDLQRDSRSHPQCVPSTGFSDFGISGHELTEWRGRGLLARLQQLVQTPQHEITKKTVHALASTPRLQAVARWRMGCRLLSEKQSQHALEYFLAAQATVPEGRIYDLSVILALAALSRFDEVDSRIALAYGLWYGDERFSAAQAMIGLAREELWLSEDSLRDPAELLPERLGVDPPAGLWTNTPDAEQLDALQKSHPDDWQRYLRERLITEQYYFVLLWRDGYTEALQFAERVTAHLKRNGRPAGIWQEYQGNAAFLMGDYTFSMDLYQAALADDVVTGRSSHGVYLKLSDLYYLTGDAERERYYRERVYGRLIQ